MVRVKKKLIQNKVSSGNLVTEITDYLSNFVILDTKPNKIKKRPLVRIFTERKIQKFNSTINNIQPLLHTNNDGSLTDKSVNENFSEITSNSINLLNNSFPLVKLSRSKARDKPFMSAALKVSIRHKHKLYNKYLTNKTQVNKLIWQKYRRNLSIVIQNSEKLYIQKMVKKSLK